MKDLREAAQQALDALEPDCELAEWHVNELREKAITALRAALAESRDSTKTVVESEQRTETEQEPVTMVAGVQYRDGRILTYIDKHLPLKTLLYTHPASQPVMLTDEEIAAISTECAASAYRWSDFEFARAVIEAYQRKQEGKV